MAQVKQGIAETVRDLRITLWATGELLRRMDTEEAEEIAKRLDALRVNLKPFAEKLS